jgi:cytochrome P450
VRFFGRDAVLITRFDDVREALRDEERFPGGDYYRWSFEPVLGPTFISMDGREHDLHRKLATPAFHARPVARLDEKPLMELAHEVVDRFATQREGDLVAELTMVLPFEAITRKLGLPDRAEDELRHPAEATSAAARAFAEQMGPLLAERRSNPGSDLLSQLATTRAGELSFSDEELISTIRLLYGVGASTLHHALGIVLALLLHRPSLLDRARNESDLLARVVHEALRCDGPVGVLPRLTRDAVQFAGVGIPARTIVLLGLTSANRDPRVFGELADQFDADREPSDILAFGFGSKFCPGSHLARSELLAALTVVLERLPGLRLTDPRGSIAVGGVHRQVEALHCAWEA